MTKALTKAGKKRALVWSSGLSAIAVLASFLSLQKVRQVGKQAAQRYQPRVGDRSSGFVDSADDRSGIGEAKMGVELFSTGGVTTSQQFYQPLLRVVLRLFRKGVL